MFSSSSRNSRIVNADGSRNVHCYLCNEFIARTYLRMDRALCALCQRIEAGEEITEQALKDYKLSKADKTEVSMLLLEDKQPETEAKRFNLFRSLGGGILRAMGIPKPPEPAPESQKISQRKRRPRLFENMDLNQDAMSITDVDKVLKKKSPL
jgi:hypothetical protein